MSTEIRQQETTRENPVTQKHAPNGPAALPGDPRAKPVDAPLGTGCPDASLPSSSPKPNPRGLQLTTYDLANRDRLIERMMDNHRPAMRRLAASRWAGSSDEVEDIVQSAIIQAWEQRSELGLLQVGKQVEGLAGPPRPTTHDLRLASVDPHFKNWLCRYVVRAIDRAKYQARREPRTLSIPEDVPTKPARAELRRIFADRIAALPQRHRDVLNLHLDGCSNVKIAEEIGYAPGGCARETVRVILKEAKARILAQVRDSDECDFAGSLFAQCSKRTEYVLPGHSWFPWTEMLPGDMHWTNGSAIQRQTTLEHALANPDLEWNAMWTKLAESTRFEDTMSVPEEFRHLCKHTKK